MITIIKLKNEVLKSYKSGELNKNETNYFLNKLTWLQVNPIISNAQNLCVNNYYFSCSFAGAFKYVGVDKLNDCVFAPSGKYLGDVLKNENKTLENYIKSSQVFNEKCLSEEDATQVKLVLQKIENYKKTKLK